MMKASLLLGILGMFPSCQVPDAKRLIMNTFPFPVISLSTLQGTIAAACEKYYMHWSAGGENLVRAISPFGSMWTSQQLEQVLLVSNYKPGRTLELQWKSNAKYSGFNVVYQNNDEAYYYPKGGIDCDVTISKPAADVRSVTAIP